MIRPVSRRPMRRIYFVLVAMTVSSLAWSAQEAVTNDGSRVMLHDDGTWTAIAQKDQEKSRARLVVERVEPLSTGCRIGLRLHNELTAPIRSLVLRFTAYKDGPVAYETVTRGFSFIKPTDSQYQEMLFAGIKCAEIQQLQVHAADKCHAGDLTDDSGSAKRCLSLVHVADSDLIKIFK